MAINARPRGFLFNEVSIDSPERSAFDLSFENKLSCNFGDLIPTMCKEVLPGDTFEIKSQSFARFAPMLAPLMHKVDIHQYLFFAPYRLLMEEWPEFISPGDGKVTMQNQPSYVAPDLPYLNVGYLYNQGGNHSAYLKPGTLADYLGLQSTTTNNGMPDGQYGLVAASDQANSKYCSLPFRAYQLIYNEYFRDQNLTSPVEISLTSGQESSDQTQILLTMRKKAWEKDMFTSALPLPQRGPDVYLPLGDSANVVFNSTSTTQTRAVDSNGNAIASISDDNVFLNGSAIKVKTTASYGIVETPITIDNSKNLKVDLSTATSATINTLRMATRLQSFLEKSARVGGRYVESILAHFGVTASDARIQRPEYISGTRIPVQISAVTAQSASNVTIGQTTYVNAQGTQTGTAMANGSDFATYTAEEHGLLMQITVVVPRTAYCQGIDPMYLRRNYLDFAWPEFGHLGEQEVKTKTLYGSAKGDDVFGYQSRYAEYKYSPDQAHGEFTTSLDFWTMTRKFANQPLLNESFILIDPTTTNRPFAVTSNGTHHVYLDIWHDIKALRCLPLYGTPTL